VRESVRKTRPLMPYQADTATTCRHQPPQLHPLMISVRNAG
jgi:hypothetical protein